MARLDSDSFRLGSNIAVGTVLRWGHHLLQYPIVFDTYQRLIGTPGCHDLFVRNWICPRPGDRILDIGCGVGAILDHMPASINYTGIDVNAEYIDKARSRFGHRGTFVLGDVAGFDTIEPGSFDRAVVHGVFHHVDDHVAKTMLELAKRACKPGGKFAIMEPAYVPGQHSIAKWLIDRDRGRHVRSVDAYLNLVGSYGAVETELRHDLLRVPYTLLIMRINFP
jgi:SAM-dependent methyltransferase